MNIEQKNIRKDIVKMACYSKSSHIGSALSVADILYVLYSKIADINANNVSSLNRDIVLLSKGHSSMALYAVLANKGLIEKNLLNGFYVDGGSLPGHLDKDITAGIDASSGSLGHCLSIGIGAAIADASHNVYAVLGDGECNEGSVWEGFIFAGKRKLKNLTVVIDKNDLQAFGRTQETADYSLLKETLTNFGLDAVSVDGHNLQELEKAFQKETDRTKVVIADTIKGKGVSFMENQLKWHYKSPNDAERDNALKELSL
jgi:transketolase